MQALLAHPDEISTPLAPLHPRAAKHQFGGFELISLLQEYAFPRALLNVVRMGSLSALMKTWAFTVAYWEKTSCSDGRVCSVSFLNFVPRREP